MKRIVTKRPAVPMMAPITARRSASDRIMRRMLAREAPSAERMPISAVRCETFDESMP